MSPSTKDYLNQDLKVLLRHVSKSFLTIILTVFGFALLKTSNEIRQVQLEECSKQPPYTAPALGLNHSKRCVLDWMETVSQCDKPWRIVNIWGNWYVYGRLASFLFGFKSDQGSPKTTMFRCFAAKACTTSLFYLYQYLPLGTVYLFDFSSGYFEGTVLCGAQTLIGHWSVKHLTLFSTLIQSVFYLSRSVITPIMVDVIIRITNASKGNHIQLYISIFLGIFCIVWYYMVYDTPQDHKFIMEKEYSYIIQKSDCAQSQVYRIPWKKIWRNKHFVNHIIVRSLALLQYLFIIRVTVCHLCTESDGSDHSDHYNQHFTETFIGSFSGAIISSFLVDFLTHSEFFSKAGARKTFFFLFVVANVPYFYFYLESVSYVQNLINCDHYIYMFTTSFLNSFFYSAIACQHFDLSPTFAAAQASIVFFFGELSLYIDKAAYLITMDKVNNYISKYLLLYWMVLVVIMAPVMMINTCFSSYMLQDYNKCTRDVCKKEKDVYPVNLISYR